MGRWVARREGVGVQAHFWGCIYSIIWGFESEQIFCWSTGGLLSGRSWFCTRMAGMLACWNDDGCGPLHLHYWSRIIISIYLSFLLPITTYLSIETREGHHTLLNPVHSEWTHRAIPSPYIFVECSFESLYLPYQRRKRSGCLQKYIVWQGLEKTGSKNAME